jgi:uncharacterized membrane protein
MCAEIMLLTLTLIKVDIDMELWMILVLSTFGLSLVCSAAFSPSYYTHSDNLEFLFSSLTNIPITYSTIAAIGITVMSVLDPDHQWLHFTMYISIALALPVFLFSIYHLCKLIEKTPKQMCSRLKETRFL